MVSVSSASSPALLLLQKASTGPGLAPTQPDRTDIVKLAAGMSGEPSGATKSASAVAGKFAVDTAAATGKIVVAGLGSADSWEELEELVRSNDTFTDHEEDEWLRKLTEMQEMFAAVEEFKNSSAYALIRSGSLQSQLGVQDGSDLDMGEVYAALNDLNERHGRSGRFFEF